MADNTDNHKPEPLPADPTPPHNAIGLALGGGVARGWAHIGALQRLTELGIKPSIVCGTSVGALVGGFWLAGELEALEGWARSLTKNRMLSYLDIALNGSGLIGGKRLRKALHKYLPDINIEDLPVKFTAVTAELSTGHETWLRKGPLNDAIEAAYALPGVFPPRRLNGRWLIDGALVNPLPVSVCRAFDARLVIAIGLHAGAFAVGANARREKYGETPATPETAAEESLPTLKGGFARNAIFARIAGKPSDQTPGIGEIMFASFNILMDRASRARLAADPADILITPQVSHIPLFGFYEADELIRLGRNAIDEQADTIIKAIEATP